MDNHQNIAQQNKSALKGWFDFILRPFFFHHYIFVFVLTLIVLVSYFYPQSHLYCLGGGVLVLLNYLLYRIHKRTSLLLSVHLLIAGCFLLLAPFTFNPDFLFMFLTLPLAYLAYSAHHVHQLGIQAYRLVAFVLFLQFWLNLFLSDHSITIEQSWLFISAICFVTFLVVLLSYFFYESDEFLLKNDKKLMDKINVITAEFSAILVRNKSVDALLKEVARQVIPSLEFDDCVIYLIAPEGDRLIQKAAFGSKSSADGEIVIDTIEIPLGKGIVGHVAATGQAEIIADTSADARYITDDAFRYSEIAVPIIANDKVIGIIDSEHPEKNFFNAVHLYLLRIIASLCAAKILEIGHQSIHQQSAKLRLESKKLMDANQTKSRFIANLSHDLKTPLTLITGPAKQLVDVLTGPERKKAEHILNNGLQLKNAIEELITMNETAFISQSQAVKSFDFELLMTSFRDLFTKWSNQKNISLHLPESNPLPITSSKTQLTAIVFNLFEYFIQICPKNSAATLHYSVKNEVLKWEISASFTHEAIQPQQFSTNRARQNAHSLLEMAKGAPFEHYSTTHLKLGFSLHCPKRPDSYVKTFPEQLPDKLETDKKTATLLVIEDHHELRNYIVELLSEQYVCLTSENGLKGIEMAQHTVPDLIITDLMMPGISGQKVCETLKTTIETQHIPILVLTAKALIATQTELYRLGAENYLTKPFDPNELKIVVSRLLLQRQTLRNQFSLSTLINQANLNAAQGFIPTVLAVLLPQLEQSEIHVSVLSEALKMGRNQLQRQIKAHTNMTPVQFIRHVRLHKAVHLLQTTTLSVSEIAYQVGFNNLSYFSRIFKQTFDRLPTEFRSSSHLT